MTRKELSLNTGTTTPGTSGGENMIDLVSTKESPRLLALQPLGEEVIDTTRGPAEAMFAHVLEIVPEGDDGTADAIDHLEHPIFWQHVRAALRDRTSDETPWVVCRVVKLNRAYILRGVTPEENERAQRQIKGWALAYAEAVKDAENAGDEAF